MFDLPKTTIVNKFIPKNTFDIYVNANQKKQIAEKISRITWLNKISFDTTNLQGDHIEEIQIFEIELKEESEIQSILTIIDKSIPYNILFVVRYGNRFLLSTSVKHISLNNPDTAVIDYTFTSQWIINDENTFNFNLRNSLDWAYKDFCEQLKNSDTKVDDLDSLVNYNKEKDRLDKEIVKLKQSIANCKQFNKKVELNIKLKLLEDRIQNEIK